jgi:hypothetical protein
MFLEENLGRLKLPHIHEFMIISSILTTAQQRIDDRAF